MPEKLMTIEEVAAYLRMPEEEVKRLVDEGELPAYQIGGTFLRFRREQIDAVRSEISEFEKPTPERTKIVKDARGKIPHPYSDLERDIKRKEPIVRQYDYTFAERVKDFFYFNDFYVLSVVLIALLLYIIIVQG